MMVNIINMPLNLGANTLGVELAPDFLKSKLDYSSIFSRHAINVDSNIQVPSFVDIKMEDTDLLMKNKEAIFQANRLLAEHVFQTMNSGYFPLIIGGDHALSWGSISGISKFNPNIGCVYIDAHGDFNTAVTSPSHNVHGMHMAYLMGFEHCSYVDFYYPGVKLDKKNVYFVGTRSLDIGEQNFVKEKHLNIFTTTEVTKNGIKAVTESLLKLIDQADFNAFHLSLDIDVIDPLLAPGTGVPEENGLTVGQVLYLIEKLFATGKVISMDLVEFNPLLDKDNKTLDICTKVLKKIDEVLN